MSQCFMRPATWGAHPVALLTHILRVQVASEARRCTGPLPHQASVQCSREWGVGRSSSQKHPGPHGQSQCFSYCSVRTDHLGDLRFSRPGRALRHEFPTTPGDAHRPQSEEQESVEERVAGRRPESLPKGRADRARELGSIVEA